MPHQAPHIDADVLLYAFEKLLERLPGPGQTCFQGGPGNALHPNEGLDGRVVIVGMAGGEG